MAGVPPARWIAFAEIGARRLDVGEQRDIETMDLPVVRVKLDAGMLRHGRKMRLGVGRSADRRVDADGIEKGFPGQDVGGFQVLENEFHGAASGTIGHLPTLAIGSGDGARSR